jgi:hypothetical protein
MKLKTFADKRTFTEKTGIRPEDMAGRPAVYTVTPEEQADREKRIKPPPERHIFDIEISSLDNGKEPERLFIEALFCYYFQFKNAKTYSGKHLYKFTVREFCQHHEIERADLNKIISASFDVWHTYQKAWQADRYRPEILQQIQLYLKERPAKAKPPANLQDMFRSQAKFKKLCSELLQRKLATSDGEKYGWNGTKPRGAKKELAAVAKVCGMAGLYKKEYQAKELYQAWTTFFSFECTAKPFEAETQKADVYFDSYVKKHSWIRHTI